MSQATDLIWVAGDSRPHDWIVGIDKMPGTTQRGPNLIHDITKLEMFL